LEPILELNPGHREQQRVIHVRIAQRLRSESLGVGGERLRAGVAALDQRDHAGEHGDEQHGEGAGQQPAQTAVGPELGAALPGRLGQAGVDEAAFGGVEGVVMGLR